MDSDRISVVWAIYCPDFFNICILIKVFPIITILICKETWATSSPSHTIDSVMEYFQTIAHASNSQHKLNTYLTKTTDLPLTPCEVVNVTK